MFKTIIKLILSILIAFIPAAIGNLATIPNIPSWYATLDKPFLNPPNWIFGPVWTTLYVLIGISLFLLWQSSADSKKTAFILFAIQTILNTAWSLVFFGLHLPWLSLAVILTLIITIILSISKFRPLSPWASYLFIPYLLWVSFATYLNLGIALLN